MGCSKHIRNRSSVAGCLFLAALSFHVGTAVAGFPYPCEYYQQKAVESENMASQESSVQVQQSYHQAAAALYREAAGKYRAEYEKCLRQSPASPARQSPAPGIPRVGTEQVQYPPVQDQSVPDHENERRRAQKRQALQQHQSAPAGTGAAPDGESAAVFPEAEPRVEWNTAGAPESGAAARREDSPAGRSGTSSPGGGDAANGSSPWGEPLTPPAAGRSGQQDKPAGVTSPEPAAAAPSPVVTWNMGGETGAEAQETGSGSGSPASPVTASGTPAGADTPLIDISKVDDAASAFNIPAQDAPAAYAESGMGKLDVRDYLSREKISAWYDNNARPLVDTAVGAVRTYGREYASTVVDQVMDGEDVDLPGAARSMMSERFDRFKEAAREAIKEKALDLYFNYAAKAKYGKSYSELDDADKLDIYTNKAAANMIFTPVRALLTRNLDGAGDAHGTETEYILNQAEKVVNP